MTVTWVIADRVPENTVTVIILTMLGVVTVGSVETGAVGAVSVHALVVVENEEADKPQEVTMGTVCTQSQE